MYHTTVKEVMEKLESVGVVNIWNPTPEEIEELTKNNYRVASVTYSSTFFDVYNLNYVFLGEIIRERFNKRLRQVVPYAAALGIYKRFGIRVFEHNLTVYIHKDDIEKWVNVYLAYGRY